MISAQYPENSIFIIMCRQILLVLCLFPATVAAQISVGGTLSDLPLEHMRGGATSTHALFGEQGVALVFWSNDCNWTNQYEDRVLTLSTADIPVVLVNSNDPGVFPKESEAGKQYAVAYVRDQGGGLAQHLGAERTPHVFVFDAAKSLVYAGGIDDSPADAQAVQASWFQDVMTQLSSGNAVTISSTKSFGCRIKLP